MDLHATPGPGALTFEAESKPEVSRFRLNSQDEALRFIVNRGIGLQVTSDAAALTSSLNSQPEESSFQMKF